MLSSTEGWSVGSDGGAFHTLDGGRTWVSSPTGSGGELYGVFFLDQQHGWAVGGTEEDDGLIVSTSDGGATWVISDEFAPELAVAVSFIDAQHGWIVGEAGLVLFTSDGGNSWQRKEVDTGTDLNDIAFFDPSVGIAVGDAGVIVRTEDGGANWREIRAKGVKKDLFSVALASTKRAVIAGADGLVMISDDKGKTWSPSLLPVERVNFYSVSFVDEIHGLVSGDSDNIWRTADGGKNWSEDKTLAPDQEGVASVTLMVASTSKDSAVAVGANGKFLYTDDGGKKWQPTVSGAGWGLNAISCLRANRCWIGGTEGRLLYSDNGGDSWSASELPIELRQDISSIAFANEGIGWAVGTGAKIAQTKDGGKTWHEQPSGIGPDALLNDIEFLNEKEGWAAGLNGILLHTSNGGLKWNQKKTDTEETLSSIHVNADGSATVVGSGGLIFKFDAATNKKSDIASGVDTYLSSIHFVTPNRGYIAGSGGVVLVTTDEGKSWRKLETGVQSDLTSVAFSDIRTGWAVGAGVVLATRDGGESWINVAPEGDETGLLGMAPIANVGAILVGEKNTVWLATKDTDGPKVTSASIEDGGLGDDRTHLKISLEKNSWSAVVSKVQFTSAKSLAWRDIGSATREPGDTPIFTKEWSFADFDLRPQTEVRFRVLIQDDKTPSAWLELPMVYKYQPMRLQLWQDYKQFIVPAAVPIAAFASWLLLLTSILVIRPVALVRFAAADGIFGAEGGGKWAALAGMALQLLVVPWFVGLPRVTNAWAVEYRAGRVRLADLGPNARNRFLINSGVLDVWVEKNHAAAKNALEQHALFRSRRIYIPLPLRVGEQRSGQLVPQPSISNFREWFSGARSVVAVTAEGGSGKTTIAVTLALHAMSDAVEDRLTAHIMIPVILERDFSDVAEAVQQDLAKMVGPDAECTIEIVRALMMHRRILVIADGLSERSLDTQRYVCELNFIEVQPNALIITSRREPDLGALPHVAVFLKKIEYVQLMPFIFEYLNRRDLAGHFTASEQLELGKGVVNLISEDSTENSFTPLLVTLFVESALANVAATFDPQKLPTSIPEIFVDYVRLLVSRNSDRNVPVALVIKRAKTLASISLKSGFVPAEFHLESSGVDNELAAALKILQDAGIVILRDVAGNDYYLFALDPLAEHLAALDDIERMGENLEAWKAHIQALGLIDGFPTTLEGYLLALVTCYKAYQRKMRLPEIDFPWLVSNQIST
ncbi:hypothetical protein E0H35_30445 [Rhizobium leguminosarum bv. viciae]|uniref:YCF48-related protein n=1 Tax=Rhizobium leguminosarum TaxID=384 RepID=UPI001038A4F6|nr:YCF48-related protein [Rhizobium leguminosarum]MBY5340414.1 hypothetical protein [Rhizobium leguminosarum]NKK49314.1 hypothetical protein [Rhizobium leguminosarum bv. viciae]TBY90855.1 hypothetical protein E0H35_30445 [Rhizobium leguminosarum bv. viciae]